LSAEMVQRYRHVAQAMGFPVDALQFTAHSAA
jgi:hypothetical protein